VIQPPPAEAGHADERLREVEGWERLPDAAGRLRDAAGWERLRDGAG
jgi:hypothetical protein